MAMLLLCCSHSVLNRIHKAHDLIRWTHDLIVLGKKVRVFRDQEGSSTNVLDLWTDNDRLLVTSCHQGTVLCYQLMYE